MRRFLLLWVALLFTMGVWTEERRALAAIVTDIDWPSDQDLQQSRTVFKRFNNALPHISQTPEEQKYGQTWLEECDTYVRECLDYTIHHMQRAIAAVPSNPGFIDAYKAILKLPVWHGPDHVNYEDPEFSRTKLFDSARLVLWAPFVSTGTIDVATAIEMQEDLRRLMTTPMTIRDRTVCAALRSIHTHHLNLAMWANQANPEAIDQLAHAVRPFTVAERSYELVLAQELMLLQERLADPAILFPEYEGSKEFLVADIANIYQGLTEISNRNWSSFWNHGLNIREQNLISELQHYKTSGWLSISHHLTAERSAEAQGRVMAALGDVYSSRVSPGILARPAPAHWAWAWKAERNELCLIPQTVHPSHTAVYEVCAEYITADIPVR